MKTRQQIIDLIESHSGSYVAKGGLAFTLDEDTQNPTIFVRQKTKNVEFCAFLMKTQGDKMDNFHLSTSGDIANINDLITFVNLLILETGAETRIHGSEIVEKKVLEKDVASEANLMGQVQAYKDILSGRTTIEKYPL